MKKEKSLIAQNNSRGIKKIVNNVVEFIRAKIDKKYILSENSPERLKRNRKLILKTIKSRGKGNYLDQVPRDILLEELQQPELPVDGIIDTAFKVGYLFSKESNPILLSEEAKGAIIQYIERLEVEPEKSEFDYLQKLLLNIDVRLLQDLEFREKLVNLAIKKGYKINKGSPEYLRQNDILAENYYKDLLGNNRDGILSENILNSELLKSPKFLINYINLLKQNGIDEETIVNSLTHNENCINVLKKDLELFQIVFENIIPANLEKFFNKFFTKDEVEELLRKEQNLKGNLLRLSKLYAKDNTILQTLNGKLLDKQYQNIPNYKMQIIARHSDFQEKILSLNQYEYSLYSKMVQLVSQKTNRWNRFEKNIIENLSNGYYGDLIRNLYEEAQKGNKITAKDLETLTFLLSKEYSFSSMSDKELKDKGLDKEKIKQYKFDYSNNIFNISNKKELENYEEIKELVCDTILVNPSLDDEQLTEPISKYLEYFKRLSELDRMKLALLQKYYNMDLKEAANIVKKFSTDIDNITFDDEYKASIVEQIKAIKNIFESNDINILSQIGYLNLLVQTDLSVSTYLIEQTKEMFEQLYKENLYMPKQEDKIGNTSYNGKNIEVFEANVDFSMFVKNIGKKDVNSKDFWNSNMSSLISNYLRYYTCTSYMTDENILNFDDVALGFAQSTNNYEFAVMSLKDLGSQFLGGNDDICYDLSDDSFYMLPSTFEMYTSLIWRNEVIINTLGIDENGQMTKMQPDYMVYIKQQSNLELDELENDLNMSTFLLSIAM